MSLTTQQLATIKTAVNADANLTAFVAANDWDSIANYANATASPTFAVWKTNVDVEVIYDSIDWTKFTPTDAVTDVALVDTLVCQKHNVRSLVIQTKQMNLQNMLIGRQAVNASKSKLREGLRDAVTQLPAGTSGALVSAAGASAVTLLTALTRTASVVEKWLAGSAATTGTVTASLLTFEGQISGRDVLNAMAS